MYGHLQLAANWRTADIDDRQRAILEFAIDLCHCRHVTEVGCANILSLFSWIVPQFLNHRPKMAKSIVYVITLITNRNHAFHCLN